MNKTVKGIIYGGAIFFAVLCVVQLAIYIPAQVSMLKDALAGGAEKSQITDYYMQNFLPELFSFVISGFGISAILFACGMIYCKKTDAVETISQEAAFEAIGEVSEEEDNEPEEATKSESDEETETKEEE